MWTKINDYYMKNGDSTICKIWLNGKLTYELWHAGKQYAGFTSSKEAMDKFDILTGDDK